MKKVIVLSVLLIAQIVFAQSANDVPNYGELKGKYMLDGINFVDPGNEPRDTHFYIEISGEAAKKLFDSIKDHANKVKDCPFKNECFEYEIKKAGPVMCKREIAPNNVSAPKCFITIDLEKRKVVNGVDIGQGDL